MIDEIDGKIILELQKDGRTPSVNLAKKLGVSVSSVSRRIKRLTRENLIRIAAVPNLEKLGFSAMGLISLNVDVSQVDRIAQKISTYDSVHWLALTLGRFDMQFTIYARSSRDLTNFIKNELSAIPGIKSIETFYATDVKKRTLGQLNEAMVEELLADQSGANLEARRATSHSKAAQSRRRQRAAAKPT